MIIANPIYDVVFKRMMENEKLAKYFIGTLLETTIETVQVKPQEFTYVDELVGIALFRLDFIATIRTKSGETKKILIEIQKAKNQIDLMRFRNYLAEQYKKEDNVGGQKSILPITTIYILGFTLPDIPTPCIKVQRDYKDLINKKILKGKSDFVEKLTHDCFVVQVDRITDRYSTKLDKLLSIFEQRNFLEGTTTVKEYNHLPDSEDLKLATSVLHFAGTDPNERKKIEIEQEAWRSINAMFDEKEKELLDKIQEKDKALDEKDKLIEELMRKLNAKKPEL